MPAALLFYDTVYTLVYYIVGDNGASAEGSLNGTFNEMTYFNKASALETPEFLIEHLDKFGGPESYNHYAVGWAYAMDRPYQWTKQIASHFGGTHNGTVIHWPGGITARGEIRHQFNHVIDIASSVLEVIGLPEPDTINGVTQKPFEGTSMRYSFDDAAAADTHTTQYFEMMGNRRIYHNGWTAVTHHSSPWITGQLPSTTMYGNSTTPQPTGPSRATSPKSSRTASTNSSGSGSSKPSATTCCRSMTASWSG